MNWDRVQGDWKQFTGKVKQQWGKLTDNDLTQINGGRESSSRAEFKPITDTPKTR